MEENRLDMPNLNYGLLTKSNMILPPKSRHGIKPAFSFAHIDREKHHLTMNESSADYRISRCIQIYFSVPDLVFGGIDTGLLAVPALAGGLAFGVAGAIAGGVIGDSVTDGVAGFFEGGVAEWLRNHGFEESREMVTTSLGKMAGCLLGSGLVLSVAMLFGIHLQVA